MTATAVATKGGRLRTEPAPLPEAPGGPTRGLGGRVSGKFEGRAHYPPVGDKLRALRKEARMSQRDLAKLTRAIDPGGEGLTDYSVNRYENGVHAPREANADLLARALSQALGRHVLAKDLYATGHQGLVQYLEGIRLRRQASVPTFYRLLGLTPGRANALLRGAPWTGEELGRVGVAFDEARDLIASVLIEQARPLATLPEAGPMAAG